MANCTEVQLYSKPAFSSYSDLDLKTTVKSHIEHEAEKIANADLNSSLSILLPALTTQHFLLIIIAVKLHVFACSFGQVD